MYLGFKCHCPPNYILICAFYPRFNPPPDKASHKKRRVGSLPCQANPADIMLISYSAHKSAMLNAQIRTETQKKNSEVVLWTCRIEYTRALINESQGRCGYRACGEKGDRKTERKEKDSK